MSAARTGLFGFLLLASVLLGPSVQPAEPEPPTKEMIARWIKQLGDDNFFVREKAMERLEDADYDAVPALRAAAGSTDLEIAQRAKELLDRIQEPRVLLGHADKVWDVAFSPDGKRIASAGHDQTIKVWDVRARKELLWLRGHDGAVLSVCFSPDGSKIVSASADGTVKVWDSQGGEATLTFKGHSEGVLCVRFSPDGKQIASAGADNTVRLWNAQTGKPELTLVGHSRSVIGLSFSPDGKRLASGSADGTVRVWETQTGKLLLCLEGNAGSISSVCFSPDGGRIASATTKRRPRSGTAEPVRKPSP